MQIGIRVSSQVLLQAVILFLCVGDLAAVRRPITTDQANTVCGRNKFRYRSPRLLETNEEMVEGRIIGGLEVGKGDWPWQLLCNHNPCREATLHSPTCEGLGCEGWLPCKGCGCIATGRGFKCWQLVLRNEDACKVSIQLTHPYWGFIGHWCGGVLVDSMWVITGAHCLVNRLFKYPYPPFWTVVAGKHDLREKEGTEQVLHVQKIVVHNLFQEYHNDVALLKLSQPVLFGRGVAPICLPASNTTRNMRLEGLRCMATGWGQLIQGQQNSATLQRVEMPLVSTNICRKAYEAKYKIPIKKYHVCAGNVEKGSKGTCVGDSGGPLQCPIQDGRWYLIGVTSFGSGCVKPGFPDVFTRISYYIDWIHESIQKYSRKSKYSSDDNIL